MLPSDFKKTIQPKKIGRMMHGADYFKKRGVFRLAPFILPHICSFEEQLCAKMMQRKK